MQTFFFILTIFVNYKLSSSENFQLKGNQIEKCINSNHLQQVPIHKLKYWRKLGLILTIHTLEIS